MPFTLHASRAIRAALFVAALTAIVAALAVVRPPATPGPLARDFEAYYAAGQAWVRHQNPYGPEIWQYERAVPGVDGQRYEFLPFVGPPYGLPLWALFAQLPFALAVTIWETLLVAAAVVSIRACATLAGARAGVREFVMLVPIAFAFAPLMSAMALGQVALLSLAAMFVAMLLVENAVLPAAVALFMAALQPNVTLAFVAYLRRTNAVRATIFAGLAALSVALIVAPRTGNGWSYLRLLGEHGGAEKADVIQITPAAILAGLGLAPSAAGALGLLLTITVVLATIAALARRRTYDPVLAAALVCAATPFIVPFFHEHDLIVLLLPIMYCTLRLRGSAALAGAFSSVLVAIDWLGLAQRPSGLIQSALLAFAFAVVIAQQSREPRALFFALAPLVLLIALGALAQAHPAPIWPDALPRSFTPPHASAAVIWEAEQRATGLLAPNPFWALLRACSLAGCAGLWLALTWAPKRR